jgi:hypothetical protein
VIIIEQMASKDTRLKMQCRSVGALDRLVVVDLEIV